MAWGSGDFGGGLVTRRAPVHGVVLVSQAVGMLLAFALAVARGESMPAPSDLAWSAIGGVLGGIGIIALYRGLAIGRMGVVAPVTGLLAAMIPVVAGIVFEGWPAPIVLAGIALALLAVLLVSRVEDEGGGRAGLGLALVAGTTIGLFGVAIFNLTEGHVFGPLTMIRAVQAVLVLGIIVIGRNPWRLPRSIVPRVLGIGLADMAGNAAYLAAVQTGALAIASVVSSLYPVTTVVLAMAILREPMTRSHALGIVLAATAIVLIGLGSA